MIAAELVSKSAHDGHTLLVSPQTSLAVAPALYGKAPYGTMRDFAPITFGSGGVVSSRQMAGELMASQLVIKAQ